MSKRTSDALITAALHDLDPAPRRDLTEAERERADATFARIVTTPVGGSVVEPSRRRRSRLWIPVALVAAAGAAVPAVLLGGSSAYASWTAKPETLTGMAVTDAGDTCRNALGAADGGERVVIAERRGEWTFTLLVGQRSEAVCLMPDDAEGSEVPDEDGFFGSYNPDVGSLPTPPLDSLIETGSMSSSTREGWFVWVTGEVGSRVTGVTVRTSAGLNLDASVVGNRFAAWWPSAEQNSENPDAESWSYTVHLADGSSQRVDQAASR